MSCSICGHTSAFLMGTCKRGGCPYAIYTPPPVQFSPPVNKPVGRQAPAKKGGFWDEFNAEIDRAKKSAAEKERQEAQEQRNREIAAEQQRQLDRFNAIEQKILFSEEITPEERRFHQSYLVQIQTEIKEKEYAEKVLFYWGSASVIAFVVFGIGSKISDIHHEKLSKKYPALSVAIDSNKNFYYAIDPDEETAIAKAIDACEAANGRKCQEAETAKAQEPVCISVAPSYDSQFTYYRNIFHKGETDNLTSSKFFTIASIQFSGKSAKNFEVGPVSIFCNSEEMRPDLDKAWKDEQQSIEWLKDENKPAAQIPPETARPSQESTTVPLPKKEFFSVTASGLNVRSGPSTTFGSVATLQQNSCLTVEYGAAAQNGFIEIMGKTANGAQIDGYVSTRYLSAIAGTPAACVATLK